MMAAAGVVAMTLAARPAHADSHVDAHVDMLWMRVSSDPSLKNGARTVDGQLTDVSKNSALSSFNTFKYVDSRANQEVSKGTLSTFTFPNTGAVNLTVADISNGGYDVRTAILDASGRKLVNMRRHGDLGEALIFVLPAAPDQSHLVVAITLKK
jgi:hypothetical protein